jgi:hypothetical protein
MNVMHLNFELKTYTNTMKHCYVNVDFKHIGKRPLTILTYINRYAKWCIPLCQDYLSLTLVL